MFLKDFHRNEIQAQLRLILTVVVVLMGSAASYL